MDTIPGLSSQREEELNPAFRVPKASAIKVTLSYLPLDSECSCRKILRLMGTARFEKHLGRAQLLCPLSSVSQLSVAMGTPLF